MKVRKLKYKNFLNYLKQNPLALCCLIFIICFTILAIFADFFAPYGLTESDFSSPKAAPNSVHWLGTDELGRDIFSRMLYASRISIIIGIIPTTINLFVGTLLGILAGMSSKWVDNLIMRIGDIILSYPFMILAMAIIYTLGPSIKNLMITLVVVGWATIARIVRSQTLVINNLQYVEAAKLMGKNKPYIMLRHVLPNIRSTLIVLYTMAIPNAILSEAAMSFLGFGAQPPQTSLGVMVSKGRQYLLDYPWISLAPAIYILLLSICLNYFGDAVRDYYDHDRLLQQTTSKEGR